MGFRTSGQYNGPFFTDGEAVEEKLDNVGPHAKRCSNVPEETVEEPKIVSCLKQYYCLK